MALHRHPSAASFDSPVLSTRLPARHARNHGPLSTDPSGLVRGSRSPRKPAGNARRTHRGRSPREAVAASWQRDGYTPQPDTPTGVHHTKRLAGKGPTLVVGSPAAGAQQLSVRGARSAATHPKRGRGAAAVGASPIRVQRQLRTTTYVSRAKDDTGGVRHPEPPAPSQRVHVGHVAYTAPVPESEVPRSGPSALEAAERTLSAASHELARVASARSVGEQVQALVQVGQPLPPRPSDSSQAGGEDSRQGGEHASPLAVVLRALGSTPVTAYGVPGDAVPSSTSRAAGNDSGTAPDATQDANGADDVSDGTHGPVTPPVAGGSPSGGVGVQPTALEIPTAGTSVHGDQSAPSVGSSATGTRVDAPVPTRRTGAMHWRSRAKRQRGGAMSSPRSGRSAHRGNMAKQQPSWYGFHSVLSGSGAGHRASGSHALVGGIPVTKLATQGMQRLLRHLDSRGGERGKQSSPRGSSNAAATAASIGKGSHSPSSSSRRSSATLTRVESLRAKLAEELRSLAGKSGAKLHRNESLSHVASAHALKEAGALDDDDNQRLSELAKRRTALPPAFYMQHHSPLLGCLPGVASSPRLANGVDYESDQGTWHRAMFPEAGKHTRVDSYHVSTVTRLMLDKCYRAEAKACAAQKRDEARIVRLLQRARERKAVARESRRQERLQAKGRQRAAEQLQAMGYSAGQIPGLDEQDSADSCASSDESDVHSWDSASTDFSLSSIDSELEAPAVMMEQLLKEPGTIGRDLPPPPPPMPPTHHHLRAIRRRDTVALDEYQEGVGFHPSLVAEIGVWSMCLHELVRMEAAECDERAVVLDNARTRLLQLLAHADMWCRDLSRERVDIEVKWQAACERAALVPALRAELATMAATLAQAQKDWQEERHSMQVRIDRMQGELDIANKMRDAMNRAAELESSIPKRTFADKSTGHAAHSDVPLSIYPASLEVATQVSFLPTPPGTPSDDEDGSRAPSPAPQPAGVDKAQRTQRKRSPSPKKQPKPKKPAAFRPSKVTEADVRIPSSWQKYVPSMEYAREHYEPMNDRQFAAMMIQVYEEKIATDNTEGRVKDFPRFVVRFMSVHFGTRTLMAARLGGLLLTIESRALSDKYVQLFAQFCGIIYPALPLGAATFVMDALSEAFPKKLPMVYFTSKHHDYGYTITVPRDSAIVTARAVANGFNKSDINDAEQRIRSAAVKRQRQHYKALSRANSSARGALGRGISDSDDKRADYSASGTDTARSPMRRGRRRRSSGRRSSDTSESDAGSLADTENATRPLLSKAARRLGRSETDIDGRDAIDTGNGSPAHRRVIQATSRRVHSARGRDADLDDDADSDTANEAAASPFRSETAVGSQIESKGKARAPAAPPTTRLSNASNVGHHKPGGGVSRSALAEALGKQLTVDVPSPPPTSSEFGTAPVVHHATVLPSPLPSGRGDTSSPQAPWRSPSATHVPSPLTPAELRAQHTRNPSDHSPTHRAPGADGGGAGDDTPKVLSRHASGRSVGSMFRDGSGRSLGSIMRDGSGRSLGSTASASSGSPTAKARQARQQRYSQQQPPQSAASLPALLPPGPAASPASAVPTRLLPVSVPGSEATSPRSKEPQSPRFPDIRTKSGSSFVPRMISDRDLVAERSEPSTPRGKTASPTKSFNRGVSTMSITSSDLTNARDRVPSSAMQSLFGSPVTSPRAGVQGSTAQQHTLPTSARSGSSGRPLVDTSVSSAGETGDSQPSPRSSNMARIAREINDMVARERAARVVAAFLPDDGKKKAVAAGKAGGAAAALNGLSLRSIARACALGAAKTFDTNPSVVAATIEAATAALSSVPGIMAMAAAGDIDGRNAAKTLELKVVQDAVDKCSGAAAKHLVEWYKERRYGNMMKKFVRRRRMKKLKASRSGRAASVDGLQAGAQPVELSSFMCALVDMWASKHLKTAPPKGGADATPTNRRRRSGTKPSPTASKELDNEPRTDSAEGVAPTVGRAVKSSVYVRTRSDRRVLLF